jgi:4-hydroxy-tetrahydrodipicolinate synthase
MLMWRRAGTAVSATRRPARSRSGTPASRSRAASCCDTAGGIDADTVTLLAGLPAGFSVLAGDDLFASPLLALGAAGGILASAHLRTGDFAALIAAWQSGDAARARELGHRLVPLSAALFAEPNPVVMKGVLHALGMVPSPAVRLPLLPAGSDSVQAALSQLEALPV